MSLAEAIILHWLNIHWHRDNCSTDISPTPSLLPSEPPLCTTTLKLKPGEEPIIVMLPATWQLDCGVTAHPWRKLVDSDFLP